MHARTHAGVADALAVNLGVEMLQVVPGRVSTEVDAHLSFDTQVRAWCLAPGAWGLGPGAWGQLAGAGTRAAGLVMVHCVCGQLGACGPGRAHGSLLRARPLAGPASALAAGASHSTAHLPLPTHPARPPTLLPQATYDKALRLVDLYASKGVDPSRLYIKIASTWQVCVPSAHLRVLEPLLRAPSAL
jgi:hypothetical protein